MNRLKNEKSAYLLQHKENPVEWWAWGPEVFQKIKDENKPVFISIGYSTCHWCHVMAKEAFSHEESAKFLNENFINIKIDREEHPDLDHYFQTAAQMMSGRGGWPLSVFLTQDLKPFFTGTYFPEVQKNGMPSFKEVCEQLIDAYKNNREEIERNSTELKAALEAKPQVEKRVDYEGHFPSPKSILQALEPFQDKENGGFGEAPKFPQFAFYEWAIEQILEGMIPQEQGKFVVESLERMLMGGIFDHAKGGFHRYSTDASFKVPHFEKMLYDQAGFLRVYTKASLIYPSPLFFDSIIKTLDYLETEMKSDHGYFFSAQDADSEGVEGLYFTYNEEEFEQAVLNHDPELEKDLDVLKTWFSIEKEGNFENGLNVIAFNPELKETFYAPDGWDKVRKVLTAIMEDRKDRIPPATDNKGISSWNFQLVSALCDCIQYTKIDVIRSKALSLLQSTLVGMQETFLKSEDKDGKHRISHTTTLNESYAQLEDYVFFCEAQFRIYEVTGNDVFLKNAAGTLDYVFNEFLKDDQLLTRSIDSEDFSPIANLHAPLYDQSFRSPMSTFVYLVRKVSTIMDTSQYLEKLKSLIELITHTTLNNPLACGESLRALQYPHEAFKKIEVPKDWLGNDEFTSYIPHFSARFILYYHDRKDQTWNICNFKECEMSGNDLASFHEAFKPKEDEQIKE